MEREIFFTIRTTIFSPIEANLSSLTHDLWYMYSFLGGWGDGLMRIFVKTKLTIMFHS